MNKVYNWGILAPGKIAHKFADGLKVLPRANLKAVGSRNLQKAREFADQYGATHSYGSYQELAADPEIDIIYIATPHAFHMENALMCLQHKKAVLCEKPLAMNSAQVKRMIAETKANNCFLMEALWSRFLPHIVKTKDLIDQGTIGKVEHIAIDFGFKANYDPESRLFNPDLGGGALLDIGIYPLFFARYLMGTPQGVKADVELASTGVDASSQVELTFSNEVKARLEFTFMEFTPIEAHIQGTEGTIKLQTRWYQPGNLILTNQQGSEELVVDIEGNGYNYQAAEVMRSLDEGLIESPHWSHGDSWELMQLMDEIRRQGGIRYSMD
jgi:predicted dehydrogenase